jgi:outer membrane protein OmpA-like peptidoglycan-associated protein
MQPEFDRRKKRRAETGSSSAPAVPQKETRGTDTGVPHFLKSARSSAAPDTASQETEPKGSEATSSKAGSLGRRSTVASTGDRYEHDADRLADKSLNQSNSRPNSNAAQTSVPAEITTASSAASTTIAGGGEALPEAERRHFETSMGADFSNVRVHHDAAAALAARNLNALAFTENRDISFASGQYQPGTSAGRGLVAHELAHVKQRREGVHLKKVSEARSFQDQPGLAAGRSEPAEAASQESTVDTAVESATSEPADQCTFKLKVDKIEYCFVAKVDEANSKRYLLSAYASGAGEGAVIYTAEIWIEYPIKNEKRFITNALGKVKLLSPDKKASISFDAAELTKAWDQQAPAGGKTWDFVVLDVYFTTEKRLPVRRVFWMAVEWQTWEANAGRPTMPGGTVATFRLDASELGSLSHLFTGTADLQKYSADDQANVRKLTQERTPESDEKSDKAFDPNTFIGATLKSPSCDIESAAGAVLKVPFTEAVGKWFLGKKSFWVGTRLDPPAEIKANFKTNQSALPGGLDSDSLATFKEKVRLVLLYLQDTPNVDIAIHAYTDTVGKPADNCTLSQARAESAKKHLTDATIWTGTAGTPKALAPGRVIMTQGEGQTLAEEAFKKGHPQDWARLQNSSTEWQKLIGSKSAEDVDFRMFKVEYIPR